MLLPERTQWFAVQVMPHHEEKVVLQLENKGQEHFLPRTITRKQWSDRTKEIPQPLFPGYIFCHTKRSAFSVVLNTQGVRRIVSFGGVAYPIPDIEIQALQQALSSGREVCAVPFMGVGQRVAITCGPLQGMTGIIARQKGHDRLIITVETIMRSISVEIGMAEVNALDLAS